MAQKPFGGAHTVEKLDKLEAYLRGFLTAFKNQSWAHTIYFDAFAGTGEVPLRNREAQLPLGDQDKDFIAGSATRALNLELSFNEYIFVEKNRKRANSLLAKLQDDHPDRFDSIAVQHSDANSALLTLCQNKNWRQCRAVVFLDPFGSQVNWATIEAIAATQAIDLWYLFPAGLSVHRQLGNDGTVHYSHDASITRLFGTDSWREAFIIDEDERPDLFGEAKKQSVKAANAETVTRFMISRMEEIFGGGVLKEWLPLGRNRGHWYSLMFACSNPSKKASKLAIKLARAVIRSETRGRTK